MFKFNLGDEVKDVVNGFQGIVSSRAEYFTGCNKYGLEKTKLNKGGGIEEWAWFDENRLKLVKADRIKLEKEQKPRLISSKDKGGPLRKDQYPSK